MLKATLHLLFMCLYCAAFGLEQHATVCRFEVKPSKSTTGAAMYDISGTICFEHSMDDFRKAGDSSQKSYELTIRFKTGGKQVTANMGFENHYCDETMVFVLRKVQKLTMNDANNYEFVFSVPASAFNLPEGQHTLIPLINVTEGENDHSVLHKQKTAPVNLLIFPTQKIRVWVKHILVDSLDADGQLWDYFLVNPTESNPDIVWSLNYAGQTYFSSKVRRNVFEYSDEKQLETFNLTISKGDTLNIQAKDIDDLTPDDIIGNVPVATADPINQTGTVITAKDGQVKSLQYLITDLK